MRALPNSERAVKGLFLVWGRIAVRRNGLHRVTCEPMLDDPLKPDLVPGDTLATATTNESGAFGSPCPVQRRRQAPTPRKRSHSTTRASRDA
jgi:hypothetical protein